MDEKGKEIDLTLVKTFFDPNPGLRFCGAAVPMPVAVKSVADELNGKTVSLSEAVAKIQAATRGRGEIVVRENCILLFSQPRANAGTLRSWTHVWRVICYR